MNEIHFEIRTKDGVLRGMVHQPDSDQRSRLPVVLLVHGYFSGNRVGPARLFVDIARRLCEEGFWVFRADLLGVGDSDGRFEDVTLDSELRDLRAVVSYVLRERTGERVVIIGHSMGANIALRISLEFTEITKAILLAPDLLVRDTTDRLFDEAQLAELKTRGWTLRKGLHINNSFVQELRNVPLLEMASKLSIPIVVIQGSRDELYEGGGAEQLARNFYAGKFVEINGGDHNFLLPDCRAELFKTIVSECCF